jgi:ankyrin repeat protein
MRATILSLIYIIALSILLSVSYERAFANDIFDVIWKNDFKKTDALLQRHPELVNAKDRIGSSPLHIAAELGLLDIARLLISKGACIAAKDFNLMTPLHSAAQGHYDKNDDIHQSDITQLLIAKGADYNARDKFGNTPLIYAAQYGNYKIVELLISKGVDINEKGNGDNTPLHFASMNEGPHEMLDGKWEERKYMKTRLFLLSNGAGVNARNDLGDTPLHYAVQGGSASLEYVKILISKGADINARNNHGVTPLDLVKSGTGKEKDIADLLRKHGAKE